MESPQKKDTNYLNRKKCPGCFADSKDSKIEVESTPPAEKLPIEQHGKFLSGYTNRRVFFSYYRCSCCQLLYCPVYFTQKQLDNLYKNQTENMTEAPLVARATTQKGYYDLLTKFHTPTGDYLEIGADIGLFTKFVSANLEVNNLYLYEPNHEVHEKLKKSIGDKNYKILTKNFSASDLENVKVHTVVIIHALDHLLNPRQIMKEIYQTLTPGGIVLIVTHDESSLLARLLKKNWPPYTLQHPQLFNPSTISGLLKAEGYKILTIQKTVNHFPITHLLKGGLAVLGVNKFALPKLTHPMLSIKLGNIATIAQKPLGASA